MYYVVRRAFRSHKGSLPVGSIVESAGLRDFKFRLREKHIVEVNEHNFEETKKFFKERFDVDLPELNVDEAAKLAAEEAEKLAAEEAEKLAAEEAEKLAAEEAEKLAAEEAEKLAAEEAAKVVEKVTVVKATTK